MKICLLIAALSATLYASAQNTFPSTGPTGIGTTTPAASSLLEVKSTAKGVLFPRMTTAQRNAIASPAQGLFIFQTDGTRGFYYYDGGWKTVAPATSNFATRNLNNLTSPTAINQDLLPGSTDARNLGSTTKGWKNLYLTGQLFIGGGCFCTKKAGSALTLVSSAAITLRQVTAILVLGQVPCFTIQLAA